MTRRLFLSVAVLALAGCANWDVPTPKGGAPVFVTEGDLPAAVEYTVLGPVEFNKHIGYASERDLYPMLADEARALGGNAVIRVTSGRRLTAFSWSAPWAAGTAVRVKDPRQLQQLPGRVF